MNEPTAANGNAVQASPTLITASRVKGAAVYNLFGDKIGSVDDLAIDRRSGEVQYALMSFGGFLGIGEKFHPVPWSVLKYDTKREGYVVTLTKEELAGAPSYTEDELAAYGGAGTDYQDSVGRYYGPFLAPH